MISLVVIAFNEEVNIGRCLESARAIVDDMVVVDSFSTDKTVEIASRLGARVLTRAFGGYVDQKSWAVSQAIHDHVLLLDADEALSPELQAAVQQIRAHWTHDAYAFNRLSSLGGRWIRHGAWYPDRKVRLFDRRLYRMAGNDPHDRIEMNQGARIRRINADIWHFTNDSLDSRVASINRLSRAAANAAFNNGKRTSLPAILLKPALRFFKEFWWQMGFLDGYFGYFIAKTSAQYVFFREMKLWELWQDRAKTRT